MAPGAGRAACRHVEEVRRGHADFLDGERPQLRSDRLQPCQDIGRGQLCMVAAPPGAHLRRPVARGRHVAPGGDVLGPGPRGANDLR
eukprot:7600808-Pyramimonas_sp.AAC.1